MLLQQTLFWPAFVRSERERYSRRIRWAMRRRYSVPQGEKLSIPLGSHFHLLSSFLSFFLSFYPQLPSTPRVNTSNMHLKALSLPLLLDIATATYIVRDPFPHPENISTLIADPRFNLLTALSSSSSKADGLRSHKLKPRLRRYLAPPQQQHQQQHSLRPRRYQHHVLRRMELSIRSQESECSWLYRDADSRLL